MNLSTKFEKSVKIIHTKRECMVDSRCTVIVIFYYLKDSLMIVQTLHCFGTKSIDRDTRIPNTLCTKRLKDGGDTSLQPLRSHAQVRSDVGWKSWR